MSIKKEKIGKKAAVYTAERLVKFIFSKKATKIDKIFTVDLTFATQRQIDGEDFINFCGLLRKHELYSQNAIFYVEHSNLVLESFCQQAAFERFISFVNECCNVLTQLRIYFKTTITKLAFERFFLHKLIQYVVSRLYLELYN